MTYLLFFLCSKSMVARKNQNLLQLRSRIKMRKEYVEHFRPFLLVLWIQGKLITNNIALDTHKSNLMSKMRNIILLKIALI